MQQTLDPDLRFPSDYQALALPRRAVEQDVAQHLPWDERRLSLTKSGRQIVETMAEGIDYSRRDIAGRLGMSQNGHLSSILARLVTLDLAMEVPGYPARWRLLAGAKARIASQQ